MNKSSKEFDQELLNSLIGKKIPISSFEDELQKIFKRKSSHKLWWDNKPGMVKNTIKSTSVAVPNLPIQDTCFVWC